MRKTLGMLSLVICVQVTAYSVAAAATDVGEQDFAKGEQLLKNKQYAESRAALESGLMKNSSNVQAHFNLAEACRLLAAWACAEEHYETALHLDAKSRTAGTREPRLRKMKVWQSLEEVTAWRLLEEAKGLMAGGQAQPDQMKQAEDANGRGRCSWVSTASNKSSINNYTQTLPGRRSPTLPE